MNAPRLEVLHVPGCPNLAPLLDRLAKVTDLPVTTHEITTDAEALASGMTGSPTLLVDGTDPFASPDNPTPSLSCRLYRAPTGQLTPIPTTTQLRTALTTPHPTTP
ncbi:hypothetical protein [Kribbella sp. NPDC055071]